VDAPSSSEPFHSRTVETRTLRMHVLEAGEGDDLVLCLHGFPELSYSWRHQLAPLAACGVRVWAPDLRGYGRTERPGRTRDYAIEALMEDVDALIEAAGVPRATVIAHDWGGLVAWHFAMRYPERVARLGILNIPHPRVLLDHLIGPQFGALLYVLVFQLPGVPERLLSANEHRRIERAFTSIAVDPSRFDDADLERYRRAAAEPGALRAMLSYYRAYVRGGGMVRELWRGMPRIEAPTLMIWGARDPALLTVSTEGTERYVRGLTKRFIPNASHWVQQEAPETVNAMLTAWLRGERVPEASELG
ncbi:MAG: alpha/beta fold hydrolase, partial [Sandaracinaceae bacterium]